MPTLTFSCPKCDKLHERIKPEMVGHKVRCQCGFVFRLGSKSDKQEWFAAELKRKKALKQIKKSVPQSGKKSPSSVQENLFKLQANSDEADPLVIDDSSPSNDVLDAIPITSGEMDDDGIPVAPLIEDSDEEVLDAIPIAESPEPPRAISSEPITVHPIDDEAAYRPAPIKMDKVSSIQVESVESAVPPTPTSSLRHLPAAKPTRPAPRRTSPQLGLKKRGVPLNSPGGPVWTLVLTLLGIPGLMVVMVFFAGAAFTAYRVSSPGNFGMPGEFGRPGSAMFGSGGMTGNLTAQLVFSLGMLFLYALLAMTMIVTAVVAVMELANSVFISWASKLSGIVASVVLVFLFLLFCVTAFMMFQTVGEFEKAAGVTIDKSVLSKGIFWLAFRYSLFALVPLAVMITGFARVFKR